MAGAEVDRLVQSFTERGYVVVPRVLSAAQVADARSLLGSHREAHAVLSWDSPVGSPGTDIPPMYGPNAESGRWQCNRLFEADDSFEPLFDTLLAPQPLVALVKRIVGADLCLRTAW